METKKFKIVNTKSRIDWTGKKVTGAHNGTIEIKEGAFIVNDGQLTGGDFIIDTTSIKILDITDPDTNAQFAGHLASDDFFSIEQFPTARFTIIGIKSLNETTSRIDGTLTIKGITHPLSFEASVKVAEDVLTAIGKIVVDRTKYDMKFRSGNFFLNLGDTLIYNDFELDINLTATSAILNN